MLYTAGQVSSEFGYVIFAILLATFQHSWMASQVGKARKKFGVVYPDLYAVAGMAPAFASEKDREGQPLQGMSKEHADAFNRVQRVHQNNCEVLPTFLVQVVIAGLGFPWIAFAFCLVWVAGRQAYAYGYYIAVEKRLWGAFSYVGSIGTTVLCLAFGIQLLRGVGPS